VAADGAAAAELDGALILRRHAMQAPVCLSARERQLADMLQKVRRGSLPSTGNNLLEDFFCWRARCPPEEGPGADESMATQLLTI
jgi:hypothetical protein